MTPDEFQQELNRLEKEFKDYFDKYAAKIAGNIAVSYFKKNYETESWGRVKWKEVKRRLNPNTKGARAIHQILVETGDLIVLNSSLEAIHNKDYSVVKTCKAGTNVPRFF